jgi:nuclear transport factor 2 (NTF2) superfamily protein
MIGIIANLYGAIFVIFTFFMVHICEWKTRMPILKKMYIMEQKFPLPPFTIQTAIQKVQLAEDAWNTKDPERVALAYTVDSEWRNRNEFINGREAIQAFLTKKWAKELAYQLKKELWAFYDNRIAVRFEYEYHDAEGQWFRAYGNENWEFDENGLMEKRYASINDVPIAEEDRKLK